jgi:Na+/H+ antiporter NhaD/arsenite permease-like protein
MKITMEKLNKNLIPLIIIFILTPFSKSFAIQYEILPVNPLMISPFILLLLSIALAPFISKHWWEKNYPFVAISLGATTVFYYLFILDNNRRLFAVAIEYISFIVLIGSLFVVSGGIHINIKRASTPLFNVFLLAFGAVISNILGTTGASMVLIRPFIRTNKHRIAGYHIVFFIFIVSNIGGMLTPIGDPPLFLGYLKGIPFFWVIGKVWSIWLTVNIILLCIFYIIDRNHYKKHLSIRQTELAVESISFQGLHNILFLVLIIFAVFMPEVIREIIMLIAGAASYCTTKKEIHKDNEFNFIPIKEVAILFAGIFATMVTALDWLELNAAGFGMDKPGIFYWGTGVLSSFLDNAPTYLSFLTTAFGLHGLSVDNITHMKAMLGMLPVNELAHLELIHNSLIKPVTASTWEFIRAISVGAVMFGACTYIGNGPNFMVKSIAEQAGIQMPTFLGYIVKYTIPILLPVFFIVWLFCFYHK